MVNVAVVLSGCGYLDGSEIQEAVFTLYFLDLAGAKVQCFAPDRDQMHVMDHVDGEAQPGRRNVLRESARIARGEVKALSDLDMSKFDVIFMPGGFGAAKNLSDFATQGAEASVDADLLRALRSAFSDKKPIGAVCIAPAVLAAALREENASVMLTIGDDPDTAAALEACGAMHRVCPVDEAVFDDVHKIASAPAYLHSASPKGVAEGIRQCVDQVVAWASQ